VKRISKAEIILRDARGRVTFAKERVRAAQENLAMLIAGLGAHQEAYDALEAALARKTSPKSNTASNAVKKSKPKPSTDTSAASSGTETETVSNTAVCAVPNCGMVEDAPVHYPSHMHYHLFHATIKTKGAKAAGVGD